MFSLPVGMQTIQRESACYGVMHHAPRSIDRRVGLVAKKLSSATCQSTYANRLFSALKFLCLTSLLANVRAQSPLLFNSSMEISALTGMYGFALNGEHPQDFSGYALASAGDVNGDGITDLVIGASGAEFNGYDMAGKTYVVFGRGGLGGNSMFELSSLNGTNGFVVVGAYGTKIGLSVSSAGDMNGDGIGDLLIGSDTQTAYVVFGGAGLGANGVLMLEGLNGINGFALDYRGGYFGTSVANAGDINGDGMSDLVIGAPPDTAVVIFGKLGLGGNGIGNFSIINGSNGLLLRCSDQQGVNQKCGQSVAGAGDVNGDGISDLVIGSPNDDNYRGKGYVIFGRAGLGGNGTLFIDQLNGSNGFILRGEPGFSICGQSVAGVGDVNGDGIADLMIGAPNADSKNMGQIGKSYIVFGRAGLGGNGTLELSSLDGTNGFVLNGEQGLDNSGSSVASAGDINSDGIADLAIGAPGSGNGTGRVYVVFGRVGLGGNGTFELSSLNGTNGFMVNGGLQDGCGEVVANIGDVNNDGITDLGTSDSFESPEGRQFAGRSYVVFGRGQTHTKVTSVKTMPMTAQPNTSIAMIKTPTSASTTSSPPGSSKNNGSTSIFIRVAVGIAALAATLLEGSH